MPNPQFYERQRLRMSAWDTPRFLLSYDETLDGGLVLPRGLTDTVAALVDQAGSRLAFPTHAKREVDSDLSGSASSRHAHVGSSSSAPGISALRH